MQKQEEDKNEMSPLCDECYKFSIVPLNHPINSIYKADLEEKEKIMRQEKISEEEAIKKIQERKVYTLCNCCRKTLLCATHYKIANYNNKMCKRCCWNYI
jgi:hypothetical protein